MPEPDGILPAAEGRGPQPGPDGRLRPAWALGSDLLREYYDTEWGMPVRDERGVFERLSLEAFQSGLSWEIILRKRETFRHVFEGFDPDVLAAWGPKQVEAALQEEGIVRNRAKVEATVTNARATVALRERGGLAHLVWSHRPERTPAPRTEEEVPTTSAESAALAAALKRAGFRFVGPTTMYALMSALGIVDTHLVGSWRRGTSGVWHNG